MDAESSSNADGSNANSSNGSSSNVNSSNGSSSNGNNADSSNANSGNGNNGNGSDDGSQDFSRVASIACGWMVDFCFSRACRHFREGDADQLHQTLTTLEAVFQGFAPRSKQTQKNKLAGFLGRVMHGQELDVVYEDARLTPLMSATNLWKSLRDALGAGGQDLHSSITTTLYIQSVAVCLEKGQKTMAFTALKWLVAEHDIPENLAMKLSVIVTKGDIHHPFMINFPYELLLEKVREYVDAFLAQNPSGFLLQAAAKVAQSCQSKDSSDEQESSSSDTTGKTSENKKTIPVMFLRHKRRLLATKQTELWKPDSAKKPRKNADNQETYRSQSAETTLNTARSKKKWTYEMDERLKKGVRKHGEGKWALILLDHDFGGRTGTMLKDRWRILKKGHVVT